MTLIKLIRKRETLRVSLFYFFLSIELVIFVYTKSIVMKVEVKTVNLTKSKINQMDYRYLPSGPNFEVLGWVNLGKKKYTIVKNSVTGKYYRTEYILKVQKKEECVQHSLPGGGYEFPTLTVVKCETFNGGLGGFVTHRADERNIELYNDLVDIQNKTAIAGQIYY